MQTDPCVSYEGTRTAIERVGFAEKPGGSYRPWFFNAEKATTEFLVEKPLLFGPDLAAIDAGAQFAGHVVSYEHDLSFLTVHGSGHMVPQFRPQAALRMLRTVLSTDLLAPLFESDDALSKMSDAEYSTYLDSWTVKAKGMVAPQKTVV
jgi:cathepsin A (carboxypeptidase C)